MNLKYQNEKRVHQVSEPIRLMQITHDLAIGGLQQVVVNLCKTIDRKKFHVTILCLRDLGPLSDEIKKLGIKVILLPQKRGTDYLSFLKVAAILKKEKTQVIHTHNTQPLFDGTIGALLYGNVKRIIHTDHARQFPDKRRYMFAEWMMSHFVHKMVGVSAQTTENLRLFEHISKNKLTTITNGIDGTSFDVTIDIQAKKKFLGIIFNGPVIGIIARLEKVKGITYLLNALPQIIESYPDLTLLIVGDGSEIHQLRRESEQLGVTDHIVFTGSRLDIPEILKVLDVYVLPSLSEGLPMGLLEAMASGCPIVASNVGGIPGLVEHEVSAMLTAPGDPIELANTVIQLLGDVALQKKLSQNVEKLFNQFYSADLMTRKYSELYESSLR